jgi:hypothetical protein
MAGLMARRSTALRKSEPELFEITPFLTSFDPSDLPGSSVDPLGFDRGYNLLADKLLPGLTNVGRRPRYLSLLCAGTWLGSEDSNAPERLQSEIRLKCLLRLERLWVLANLLASDDVNLPSQAGVRGALYGRAHLERLEKRGEVRTGTDFELLVRQVPYGVVGIYGNIAHGMRLLDRKSMSLTPALGEKLGEAFLEETATPSSIRKAAREPSADVALSVLQEWGQRAHLLAPTGPVEAECLGEALHAHPVRSRLVEHLLAHPWKEQDSEQDRLGRIAQTLASRPRDADLHEALEAILAFETCYRWTLLTFERLLWLAKNSELQSVSGAECTSDPVLREAMEAFPRAVGDLEDTLDGARTEAFLKDQQRLNDLRLFLKSASAAASIPGNVLGFVDAVVERHGLVQRGKFDKGRPKLPWIERKGSCFQLTLARVGELAHEPRVLDDITPHAYRLASADALIEAARIG